MGKGILVGVVSVFLFVSSVAECASPKGGMVWGGPSPNVQKLFEKPVKRFVVEVTAYSATKKQNVHRLRGASGERLLPGSCAVSHDLQRAGVRFGDRLHLPGIGVFVVHDLTHPSLRKTVDVFHMQKREAKKFGRKLDVALSTR